MAINGLPASRRRRCPPTVRNGSDDDKQAYKAALGFEQILLDQLVGEMLPKGTLTEGPYAAPMQDAFTGGLIADGGIGLAAQLYPTLQEGRRVSTVLEAELLVHLDTQIASARRLLALVLEQGKAIRERDVDAVLARLADVQTEMGRRGGLEQDRAGAAAARRRRARRPGRAGHARGPVRARQPRCRRARPASAPPSCAACSPRSPASTASTAR